MIELRRLTLDRGAGGGFRLQMADAAWEARPQQGDWHVAHSDGSRAWRLVSAAPEDGFLLSDPEEGELGRTVRMPGHAPRPDGCFVVLDDGRLFRIEPRGAGHGRFEVYGWETSGAYLVARPERSGWCIEPTPAGRELERADALLILLAAVILDAEENEMTEPAEPR